MNAYKFSADEQAAIVREFGSDFYDKMKITLELCAEKWHLSVNSLLPYFSVNCVFTCSSEKYGEAVLKIGRRHYAASAEAGTLTEYVGNRFCRIFEADTENDVLLVERLLPGRNLFYETTREQRIAVFAGLYNGLHIKPHDLSNYPAYKQLIERFIATAGNREDIKEHGDKAMGLYNDITRTYTKTMLLHGDLHHENIISDGAGYRIIDPTGIIGDPVFDCSRFIMKEFGIDLIPCKHADIINFAKALGKAIGIPPEVLLKCMYIEAVIWMGEDLYYFNWLDDYMIDNAIQAEKLMSSLR